MPVDLIRTDPATRAGGFRPRFTAGQARVFANADIPVSDVPPGMTPEEFNQHLESGNLAIRNGVPFDNLSQSQQAAIQFSREAIQGTGRDPALASDPADDRPRFTPGDVRGTGGVDVRGTGDPVSFDDAPVDAPVPEEETRRILDEPYFGGAFDTQEQRQNAVQGEIDRLRGIIGENPEGRNNDDPEVQAARRRLTSLLSDVRRASPSTYEQTRQRNTALFDQLTRQNNAGTGLGGYPGAGLGGYGGAAPAFGQSPAVFPGGGGGGGGGTPNVGPGSNFANDINRAAAVNAANSLGLSPSDTGADQIPTSGSDAIAPFVDDFGGATFDPNTGGSATDGSTPPAGGQAGGAQGAGGQAGQGGQPTGGTAFGGGSAEDIAGGVIQAFGEADRQAQAANEFRYQDILGGYNARTAFGIDQLEGLGDTARFDINRRYDRQASDVQQNANQRGLGNTTIVPSLQRGVEEDRSRMLTSLDEDLARERIDVGSRLSGDTLAFAERRNDVGPQSAEYLGLLNQLGASGFGQGGLQVAQQQQPQQQSAQQVSAASPGVAATGAPVPPTPAAPPQQQTLQPPPGTAFQPVGSGSAPDSTVFVPGGQQQESQQPASPAPAPPRQVPAGAMPPPGPGGIAQPQPEGRFQGVFGRSTGPGLSPAVQDQLARQPANQPQQPAANQPMLTAQQAQDAKRAFAQPTQQPQMNQQVSTDQWGNPITTLPAGGQSRSPSTQRPGGPITTLPARVPSGGQAQSPVSTDMLGNPITAGPATPETDANFLNNARQQRQSAANQIRDRLAFSGSSPGAVSRGGRSRSRRMNRRIGRV